MTTPNPHISKYNHFAFSGCMTYRHIADMRGAVIRSMPYVPSDSGVSVEWRDDGEPRTMYLSIIDFIHLCDNFLTQRIPPIRTIKCVICEKPFPVPPDIICVICQTCTGEVYEDLDREAARRKKPRAQHPGGAMTMTEPMSDKRLAEIERTIIDDKACARHDDSGFEVPPYVDELLAEVKRLHLRIAELREDPMECPCCESYCYLPEPF